MTLIRRSQRTAWRRVEEEVLIISSDSNKLTILNDTAARIWELLDKPKGLEDLAAAIATEFEVEPARALADIRGFVADLQERRLVSITENGAGA